MLLRSSGFRWEGKNAATPDGNILMAERPAFRCTARVRWEAVCSPVSLYLWQRQGPARVAPGENLLNHAEYFFRLRTLAFMCASGPVQPGSARGQSLAGQSCLPCNIAPAPRQSSQMGSSHELPVDFIVQLILILTGNNKQANLPWPNYPLPFSSYLFTTSLPHFLIR